MSHDDFDVEPVPGLPARLPEGEKMLWQGAPAWKVMAREVFHVRALAVYFGLLLAWRIASGSSDGQSAQALAVGALWVVLLGSAALGMVALFAWLIARSTVYTITSRRVVIRFGVALPMTVNIPFSRIETASFKGHRDGAGDIPLLLAREERIAYLLMWPHVRPLQFSQPQPMLRCIPEAASAADILAKALAASAPGAVQQPAEASGRTPATRTEANPYVTAAA